MLQTEFDFILPRGYVDGSGTLHRKGRMRLATALDEIAPLRDPRVRQNPAYHTVILLARVITKLGSLPSIDTGTIEAMFTSDLAFLQELYRQKNELIGGSDGSVRCPSCGEDFRPMGFSEQDAMLEPVQQQEAATASPFS